MNNPVNRLDSQCARLTMMLLMCLPVYGPTGSASAGNASGAAPTVLITGSNRGIGLEFTRQYAVRGWRVIATCRSPNQADDLKLIAQEHSNVVIERLDLTDHKGIDVLAARYQDVGIDILINNAALLGPNSKQAFGSIDYEVFTQILNVNTVGTLKVTEAFRTHVSASEQKKIITLGSSAASIAMIEPPPSLHAYRASKAALHLLMKNVALEMAGEGVLVGLINPGLVDTRGFAGMVAGDPVPDDFKQIVALIRSGALELTQPEEAVTEMIELIENLTPEQSGVFLNANGEVLPW